MLLRNAIIAGLVAADATMAANNTYRWTVNNILANTITSPMADTLTLYATATYLGGEEIARNQVFLGDVTSQGYLTMDQINFSLEFSAPVTKNVSIIWSLVNTADANHTFSQDLQNLSNDTRTLVAASSGVLDGLSDTTESLLKLLIPGGYGAAFGAAVGGPAGAIVGALIGKAIDLALGSLIDNVFGCDCPVASDTVTFLPGDLQLLPIQSTTMYRGLSSGAACVDSLYEISSTLIKVPDSVTPDVQPTANWTVSLLDKHADLDAKLINFGDTLYSSDYPPRSWTQIGGTTTFWSTENWAAFDPTLEIKDGYAFAFGTYYDQEPGFKIGLLGRSLTPDATFSDGCIARHSCPAVTKLIVPARSLPLNLQSGTYLASPCGSSQMFLTGLRDQASNLMTTEAYLINTKTGNVVRIADTPFSVESPNDALVYTGAWSKPKLFIFRKDQMVYYDLSTKKWSQIVSTKILIDYYRFSFDGLSTMIFSHADILGPYSISGSYGPGQYTTSKSILTMVLDETNPSTVQFRFPPITPFALLDGVGLKPGSYSAYDPLRKRLYMAGGYNYSSGNRLPYLFAINMDPEAAAKREARVFLGSCQTVDGVCAVYTNTTSQASKSPPTASSSTSKGSKASVSLVSSTRASSSSSKPKTSVSMASTSKTMSTSKSSSKSASSQISSSRSMTTSKTTAKPSSTTLISKPASTSLSSSGTRLSLTTTKISTTATKSSSTKGISSGLSSRTT